MFYNYSGVNSTVDLSLYLGNHAQKKRQAIIPVQKKYSNTNICLQLLKYSAKFNLTNPSS